MELTLEDRIDYYLLTRLLKGGLAYEDRLIRRCIDEMQCQRDEVDRRIAFLVEQGLAEPSDMDTLVITDAGRAYLAELKRLHGWSGEQSG